MKALRLARTELAPPGADGRCAFRPLPGTEFELEAEGVVLALGFDPVPFPRGNDFSRLATNEWGGIKVDSHQMTSIPGIFAGGHIVRGPTLVLEVVRDARKAAAEIHR